MKSLLALFLIFILTPAFAEWKNETIEDVQVHYYLPKKSAQLTKKKIVSALMINLHGCSQKPEDLIKDGNWESTADDYNMIVALPKVPNGGVIAGCWDYYGADHTPQNRHNMAIIKVVKALLAKKELQIDPGQVYLSGLSSGGGETMVLGCMMPELFAGIGINAGPSTGTLSNEISRPKTPYATMLETCKKLGAGKEAFFKTQLTSIIYGSNDYIVSPTFNVHNADIMKTIYQAENKTSFDLKSFEGANKEGTGLLWSDSKGPRVSLIMNTNLGHNWPAGQGGNGGNFINKKSLNYPNYLARFFFENNRRSELVSMPEISIDPIEEMESKFKISGRIDESLIGVKFVDAIIKKSDSLNIVDKVRLKVVEDASGGIFSGVSRRLPDGHYQFDFKLRTSSGLAKFTKRHSWMGQVVGINMPQLLNTKFQVVKDCLIIGGIAISNGGEKISSVKAVVNGKTYEALVENTLWSQNICDLKEGAYELSLFVENTAGVASEPQLFKFNIADNSATSNLQGHMEAKRLNWEDYGYWYLKYGHSSFTLYLGKDGIWSDKAHN